MLCFSASLFGPWLSYLKGGWRRRGGSVFVPSCWGARPASVPRLSHTSSPSPSLYFTPAGFSFPASALSVSASFLLPLFSPHSLPVFHLLCLTHSETSAHTHTHMHSFPPLSLQSLIKGIMTVWFGGNSDALSFCRVFPQTKLLKRHTVRFMLTEWAFQECLHHLNRSSLLLSWVRCHKRQKQSSNTSQYPLFYYNRQPDQPFHLLLVKSHMIHQLRSNHHLTDEDQYSSDYNKIFH